MTYGMGDYVSRWTLYDEWYMYEYMNEHRSVIYELYRECHYIASPMFF